MTALRVWGPNLDRLRVSVEGTDTDPVVTDLVKGDDGFWDGPDLAAGTDYRLRLDDSDDLRPDPGSRRQPDGVQGVSRSYDQDAFAWHDGEWHGRDLTVAVVYELHVATFTAGATFDSAIEHLDDLAALGVTHVEVLPVNGVNGIWNWGYDGVDWYTVHEPIGGPDAFKRFVDAAHERGLAVVLDVVYNHLGPAGNFLPEFGPIFKSGRNTWGDLIDVENPGVRRFIIDNALMWLRDYHVDGLRLDAVHALQDGSPRHILAQLADEVSALQKQVGRPLTLIAESDLNDPMMITAVSAGGRGMDAQWDDDVHHALHALLTGERQGYYVDFGSLEVLAKTLTKAFLHDGTYSSFRERTHGAPIDPSVQHGWQFVVCLQDHDQVGNRAVGDRLPEITSPERLRIGAVLLLTAPYTPMLWMGEEWAASTRWPFFTSHPEPELAKATAEGRLAEFAGHEWDVSQMIDPQDPAAYRTAILNWDERTDGEHADMLALYTRLIALRAAEPDLHGTDLRKTSVDYDEDEQWIIVRRGNFRIAANLSDVQRRLPVHGVQVVIATGAAEFDNGALLLGPQSAAIVRLTTD